MTLSTPDHIHLGTYDTKSLGIAPSGGQHDKVLGKVRKQNHIVIIDAVKLLYYEQRSYEGTSSVPYRNVLVSMRRLKIS